ncbi:hypothetical protein GJAV_G00234640 [Gymnothorax javanicus]|nr:hypothetical protein GJAV_G00234640 [Gymnothorax javanicus]
MSKPVTLATCIAKMYEGGKIDKVGVSGAGPGVRKPANSALNNLSGLEVKLNLLDAKVERIANSQAEVLRKVDLVFQNIGSMEKDVASLKQPRDPLESVAGPRNGDEISLSEIRALCGETVALLQGLRLEGARQQEKLTGIESSVSAIGKVLGYVSDTFKSSKIVEFILRGIVPWRKGSLLDCEDEEIKAKSEDKAVKPKITSRETQHAVSNVTEDVTPRPAQHRKPPDPVNASTTLCQSGLPDSAPTPRTFDTSALNVSTVQQDMPCRTSSDSGSKGLRKVKEVSLRSREPIRKQSFSQDGPETGEVSEGLGEAGLQQSETQKSETCGGSALRGQAAAAVERPGMEEQETVDVRPERTLDPTVSLQQLEEEESRVSETNDSQTPSEGHKVEQQHEHEDLHQKEDFPPAVTLQQCNTTDLEQNKGSTKSDSKAQPGLDQRPSLTGSGHCTSQNKQDLPGPCDSAQLTLAGSDEMVVSSQDGKAKSGQEETPSRGLMGSTVGAALKTSEGMPRVIDDCPPLPAPFEHRIVSAKQVPISSYYAVRPNEVLGGGRFGQVHKCAELASGLTLAAKIIKVKGIKDREEVKNEIGVMNQLNHVNLIQLYDAFESRSNLTLIMEYVDGGELFDRIIDENYMLTELDAIVFMRQICEGVQYLHQQYILHLDLKPENILCVNSTGNQIKIIDFGLARKYRPREKLKVNFGTPEFLAPEVVNYDFVSFPTDMWSVGVITYMLLSGLSPFLGDNDPETMNNILHCNWDYDAEAFESVSEEAKDFISRLLIQEKCGRMSAMGCLKHSWLNNLEEKAKTRHVRLKSQLHLQRYLAAHRQWKKHFLVVAAANRLKKFRQSHSSVKPA